MPTIACVAVLEWKAVDSAEARTCLLQDVLQAPSCSGPLSNQGEKYKLVFHNGSFKEKSIKVWYSEAQCL